MLMQEDTQEDTKQQSRWLSEEEYLRRLHEIVPEGTRVVTTGQAGAIWRLRSLYQYGIADARYEAHTARIKLQAKSIHKLTPEEQIKELGGAVVKHVDFFWLEDILKVPLAPWQLPGKRKPEYLRAKYRPTGRPVGRPRKNPVHSDDIPGQLDAPSDEP